MRGFDCYPRFVRFAAERRISPACVPDQCLVAGDNSRLVASLLETCVHSCPARSSARKSPYGRFARPRSRDPIGFAHRIPSTNQCKHIVPNRPVASSTSLSVDDRRVSARSTETESDATHGVDEWIGMLRVDLAAHAPNVNIDDVRCRVEMQIPHVLQ
jgi:hypothetical protein